MNTVGRVVRINFKFCSEFPWFPDQRISKAIYLYLFITEEQCDFFALNFEKEINVEFYRKESN